MSAGIMEKTEDFKTIHASTSGLVQEDAIAVFAAHVETIGCEQVTAELLGIVNNTNFDFFMLGGYLCRLKQDELWKYSGAASYTDYLEEHFGFGRSKADYLINIYVRLVNSEVPWADVQHLGWTKLRYLSRVIDKTNADQWIEKAAAMTVREIKEAVAEAIKNDPEGTLQEKSMFKVTYTLFEDEKETIDLAIEYAKKETGWKRDGNALEGICMSYLAGASRKFIVPISDSSENS